VIEAFKKLVDLLAYCNQRAVFVASPLGP